MSRHARSARHAKPAPPSSWNRPLTIAGFAAGLGVVVVAVVGAAQPHGSVYEVVAAASPTSTTDQEQVGSGTIPATGLSKPAVRVPRPSSVVTVELTLSLGRPVEYDHRGVLGNGIRVAVPVAVSAHRASRVPAFGLLCSNSPYPGMSYLDSSVLPGAEVEAGAELEGLVVLGLPRIPEGGGCREPRIVVEDASRVLTTFAVPGGLLD